MKEYDVKITETLEKTVTVQAESHDAAEEQVRAAYYNSEYILDSENFTGVAFGMTEEREVQKEQADTMNVLLVKPFMYPQAVQIGCELEDLQKAVGGDIEATYPFNEPVALVMHDEGKLVGKDLNRALRDDDGDIYDIIAGDFLVVGLSEDDFCSLSPELMKQFEEHFHQPETFVRMGRSIMALPLPDDMVKKEDAPVKADSVPHKCMAKRPTRLRFTEDDLADSRVKKAADRADKAVDKAEKAADKLASQKAKPKLKLETDAAGSRKAKLRFEKAEFTEIERPSVAKHMASRGAAVTLTSKAHQAVSEYEDDNIGVQAVQETTKAVESTAYTVDHAVYSHKLKAYDKAEKLVEKSDKANVNALYEKFKKDNPDAASNPISRWKQKQAIKKEYAAAKAGKGTAKETAAKATKKAAQSTKTITEKAMEFCTTHSKTILFVLIAGLLFMILSGMFSSCSAMFQGGTQIVLGTSFTAKEEDIIGADNDYKALEAALRNEINNIERTHSGYDEYRYDLDEINHNPYELAAYLTVKFEDYTRDEVQATLQWLFEQQYELTLTEVVEIRTRTTSSTDPETGETTTEEEDYEYYILKVKLRNKGLNSVISNSGLSEDDMERYSILLQTRGNRPDIFGNDIYATPGGEYTDYDIPGEALTDTRFANMIREAEKYLGYPYVWGGSSPSSSFDCSGFVSWVINNCGNGWSVGRLTANGLMGVCDIIPKSSAKPGDLIFFQGTYDTSGASHVGIYVGNGMMIHCGNPISYASIESNYWKQHFYCFGRIRN